jgi:hypothetical protein
MHVLDAEGQDWDMYNAFYSAETGLVVVSPSEITSAIQLPRPPLRAGRLVGQFVFGTALAIGGAFSGAIVGMGAHEVLFDPCEDDDYICIPHGAVVGFTLGYIGGAAAGVYAVGGGASVEGSYAATLLGSIVGTWLDVRYLEAPEGPRDVGYYLHAITWVSLPIWIAMVGFNATRRYANPGTASALITLSPDSQTLDLPAIAPRLDVDGGIAVSVPLVHIQF